MPSTSLMRDHLDWGQLTLRRPLSVALVLHSCIVLRVVLLGRRS